jgi:hypothetical protein
MYWLEKKKKIDSFKARLHKKISSKTRKKNQKNLHAKHVSYKKYKGKLNNKWRKRKRRRNKEILGPL